MSKKFIQSKKKYGLKSILDSKKGFYFEEEGIVLKKYLDDNFPREIYENVINDIIKNKQDNENSNIHEEIIKLKKCFVQLMELYNQQNDRISFLEKENVFLKTKYEEIKKQYDIINEKNIMLTNTNKITNDKNNIPIVISHCSKITINNNNQNEVLYDVHSSSNNNNNNCKNKNDSMFYSWFYEEFK